MAILACIKKELRRRGQPGDQATRQPGATRPARRSGLRPKPPAFTAAWTGASPLHAGAARLETGLLAGRSASGVAADDLSRLQVAPESTKGLAVEIQLLDLFLHGPSPRGWGRLDAPPLSKVSIAPKRCPARAEERGTDADVSGSLLDRRLEVVAHPHRQPARPARPIGPSAEVVPQLAQAPEPRPRGGGGRGEGRDRHQADDAQVDEAAQRPQRRGEPGRREAMLAGLLPEVDLDEGAQGRAAPRRLAIER